MLTPLETATMSALLAGLLQLPAVAREPDTLDLSHLDIEQLMNLRVVTASKSTEGLMVAPNSIYVITEEDIRRNGYYDLKEALENIPGVQLNDPSFFVFGGQRGFVGNFSQTLILVNGREMQNLIAAETFISNQWAAHNIKQVEVINGPGSALYGANALVGVINIITKTDSPAYQGAEAQVELGANNARALSLLFGYKFGDWRFSGSARAYQSDGFDFGSFVAREDAFWEGALYSGPGSTYKNVSKGRPLTFKVEFKDFYAGSESYYNFSGNSGLQSVGNRYDVNEDYRHFRLLYGGYTLKFGKTQTLNLEYQNWEERFGGTYTYAEERAGQPHYFWGIYSQRGAEPSQRNRVNLQYTLALPSWNFISGYSRDQPDVQGVSDESFEYFDSPDQPPVDTSQPLPPPTRRPYFRSTKDSLFLQAKGPFLTEKVHLTLGARYDRHSIYGGIISVRSGLVFTPTKASAYKLLFGQAFREPTIFELGAEAGATNTDVRPAKINTYEVSANYFFSTGVAFTLTAYQNDARDFIFQTGERFFNSTELKRVRGAEGHVQYRKGSWSSDLNYSYVHPDAEDYAGERVQNLGVYEHRANLGVNYAITSHIDLNARANYYGSVEGKHGRGLPEVLDFSSFTKIGLSASFHDVKWGKLNLKGDLSVKNATDGDFFQPNIRQTGSKQFMLPGREVRARVTFKF